MIKYRNNKKRRGILLTSLLMSMILAVGCSSFAPSEKETGDSGSGTNNKAETKKHETQKYQYTDFVMDTVLSETVYGREDCTKEIQDVLKSLEEQELSWRISGSEVAKINAAFKEGKSFNMSEDFANWTASALELAEKSGGAFDPTIGELTRLWDIEGENPKVPSEEKIEACLKEIGYGKINVKENQISIEETCTIDLGAVGKGIACDEVADYLEESNKKSSDKDSINPVTGAVVAVGGSVVTYGEKPDGEPWTVAVQSPEEEDGTPMGVISLTGTHYISTSGDYEKYFEQDGKRYHHILDPHTGYPSQSDLSSVTVVCDNGLLSDGLSTACYVLGEEKAKELLKEYGAEGIFIDHKKNVTVTDGLVESFEILDETYRYK